MSYNNEEYEKKKMDGKNFIAHAPKGVSWGSVNAVITSWTRNTFRYLESKPESLPGFRSAQLGALFAIKSHWTVSSSPATVVMPTGTGKTETIIAAVISESCNKTCIVVPSDLLRKQTINRFCTLQKIREMGAITNTFKNPIVGCLLSLPKNTSDLNCLINSSNVIVTTMSLLNRFSDGLLICLSNQCDTLIIDEAHHVAASTWKRVKKFFNRVKCLQFTATPFRNDGEKVDGDIIYNFPLALAQVQGYFKKINFSPIYEFDNDKKDDSVAVTRSDKEYPKKLKSILKRYSPPAIYYCGDLSLVNKVGIGIVGSRNIDDNGANFTKQLAEKATEEKLVIFSGGAKGVDIISETTALNNKGHVVSILADSLSRKIKNKDIRDNVISGKQLLLTANNPDSPFSAASAMNRNKYIYALSNGTFVVASDYNKGGTWTGAVENIKNEWVNTFVWKRPVRYVRNNG